jgi:hypothetical protein
MAEEVRHYQVNGRYKVVFEQAASTKGVIGIKVESNGDNFADTMADAERMFTEALSYAMPKMIVTSEAKKES